VNLAGEGLECTRDDRVLFTGLDFSVDSGGALLVEGRNGTGKTTLLRMICGIRRPDAGELRYDGECIFSLGSDYHTHMAYVGHMDGIKRELTAEENLRVADALGRPGRMSIAAALERVRLAGFEDVQANKFSAGQRRRLALARLLVSKAELWVLDEPFTSLDRHGVKLVEELMAEHIAEGGMLAVTSHHDVDLGAADVLRLDLSA
jgi:heme exporter protein A